MLSGTPTAPGAYDIVIAVEDTTSGATAQEAFPLSISPLITLNANLSSGNEYTQLSNETIAASGPPGDSDTFTATGSLPPGVTLAKLSATTAQLQGTPTQWGTFSFTVTATDGNQDTGVQPPAPPPPVVTGIAPVTRTRKGLTAITVAFDEALNSGSAGNLELYSVFLSVEKHRKAVYSKPLRIKDVSYNGSARTVTINLAKPYKGVVEVTVHSGIVAADGQSSDEDFSAIVK